MKILAFVDIHSDLNAVRNINNLAKKEKPDVLLCAGDVSFFGNGVSLIIKELDIGIPLLIIPGNHETPAQIEEIEKKFPFVKNIHLKTVKKDSVVFFGCGGSGVTPNNTPYEIAETSFKNILSIFKTEYKKDYKFIFVTHEPPFNTKLDLIGNHAGSREIREFIKKYQPLYCICGHLHENEGKKDRIGKTMIINPGAGKIIEV